MLGPLSSEDRQLQRAGRLPQETREYLDSKKPSTAQVILFGLSLLGAYGSMIVFLLREVFRS